jgi:type II secretory pathway component PulK
MIPRHCKASSVGRTFLSAPRRSRGNSGTVLIAAMLVCFALAAMVVVLCRSMRVAAIAAANTTASMQADEIERGAEQYVLALITQNASDLQDLTEDQFNTIQVGDGYFWILHPQYDDPNMPIFGLTDEDGKLNINTASHDELMRLPGMTDDVAASIVNWHSANANASNDGATSDYYLSLPEPYYCKNANFETVEELLMVRGVTREMLYGDGTALPLGEATSIRGAGNVLSDPQISRGLYDLLTVYSAQPNPTNSNHVNINDVHHKNRLKNLLTKELGGGRANPIMKMLGKSYHFVDIFDFAQRCQLTDDEFSKIEHSITSVGGSTVHLINVNTAPRDVLLCLNGLESGDVDNLIAQRGNAATTPNSIAWVKKALGQKAVGLGNQITGTSYQYSADILAASGNGRGYKRVRIVIDLRGSGPHIVYRRDISDRGWSMDPQILASLRAGNGPGTTGLVGTGTSAMGNLP